MKLYIFGSCSGTEPERGRRHTAFAVEINRRYYWFDAGEGCSYTAHLMGVDLLSLSEIFISHTHMDHVGGLGNLLWNVRKLTTVRREQPRFGDLTVYLPNLSTFDGIMTVLRNTEGNFKTQYKNLAKRIEDGVIFKNGDIEVEAIHNTHLPRGEDGCLSYSFIIRAEGKTLIYSGDLGSFDDLALPLSAGCDLLLMETGHHSAEQVCKTVRERALSVGRLYFLHHGREILDNYDDALRRCRAVRPDAVFCEDEDVFEI
jgi:ribonuclease BN (tRNA processing enzyme)